MSDALRLVLTQAGLDAAADASARGIKIEVAEVGVGTAQYTVATNADGLATQTALVTERARVPLASATEVGSGQVNVSFLIDGPGEYWVREVGFYLADGTLLAVWSHATKPLGFKSQLVTFVLALEIILTQLPSDVVTFQNDGVSLDLIMTREAAITANAIMLLNLELLKARNDLDLKQHQLGVVDGQQVADVVYDPLENAWRFSITGVPGALIWSAQGLRCSNLRQFTTSALAEVSGLPRGTFWSDPDGTLHAIQG
ncbi:MAG: phage tail protein [Pseudomonadota bacterium]